MTVTASRPLEQFAFCKELTLDASRESLELGKKQLLSADGSLRSKGELTAHDTALLVCTRLPPPAPPPAQKGFYTDL